MLALLNGPAVNRDVVFLVDSNGSGIAYCNRYVADNLAGFEVCLHLHARPPYVGVMDLMLGVGRRPFRSGSAREVSLARTSDVGRP
jgi:hypothetical protein